MIEFSTPGGTRITLDIVTREGNLADHNFTSDCYRLSVIIQRYRDGRELGGPIVHGLAEVTEHAQHGTCLRMGHNDLAPIPADLIDPIRALLGEYAATVAQRIETARREEAAYQRHHDKINELLLTGRG